MRAAEGEATANEQMAVPSLKISGQTIASPVVKKSNPGFSMARKNAESSPLNGGRLRHLITYHRRETERLGKRKKAVTRNGPCS